MQKGVRGSCIIGFQNAYCGVSVEEEAGWFYSRGMVDIERHEAEIRRLEEARAKLLLQLDSLVGQFEENVPAAAAVWIHQEVQRRIAEKAEQIENMGLSGVKAFKTDVEAVIEELPKQAHRSVGDRVNWPHRRGQPGSGTGPSQEGFSDRVFRDLISTLGAVLETHHLMDDPRKYPIWERVGDGKW